MEIHGRFYITHDHDQQAHIIKVLIWDMKHQGKYYEFGLKLPDGTLKEMVDPEESEYAGLGTFIEQNKGEHK